MIVPQYAIPSQSGALPMGEKSPPRCGSGCVAIEGDLRVVGHRLSARTNVATSPGAGECRRGGYAVAGA